MNDKPKIKLTGTDGNAFAVLGVCLKAARKAEWPQEKIDAFRTSVMNGDYDNLLQAAMTHFDVT